MSIVKKAEDPTRASRGDGLISPTALAALLLWLLNDHVLKNLTPGVLTGKLSDVASLIVLPLALQAAHELAFQREPFIPSRRTITISCLLVGAFFVWMETTQLGSLVFRGVLALAQWPFMVLRAREWVAPRLVAHIADWEDLLTLPALLLAYRVGVQRASHSGPAMQRPTALSSALIIALVLASSSRATAQDVPPASETPQASNPPTCEPQGVALHDAQAQLAMLQREREELRRRDRANSLVLPITGVSVAAGGAILWLDSQEDSRALRAVGATALGALAVSSAVWLGLRVRTRRAIRADIRQLDLELASRRQQVGVAAGAWASCHTPQASTEQPSLALPNASLPPLQIPHVPVTSAAASRRAQYRLGPPIAMLAVGYGTAVVSAIVATWTWWLWAPSFELDEPATARERRIMRGFGGMAIGGAVVGAVGLAWLIRRTRARRTPVQEHARGPRRAEWAGPTLTPEFGRGAFSLSLAFAL